MNSALWFDNIRIYHLLIDRFNGGWQTPPKSENVFCGGNLQGVINKLDYIKSALRHVGGLSAAARQGPRQRHAGYLRLRAQPLLVSGTDF